MQVGSADWAGFLDSLRRYAGADAADRLSDAIGQDPSVSLRLNPAKGMDAGSSWSGIPWSKNGYWLPGRPSFTMDPLFHAGCYYVQDSSAMFVGHLLRDSLKACPDLVPADRPVRVLDLCAAPGGKTTDIAASLRELYGDGFILVSNEVMRQRAGVLRDNVAIWGDPNVVVTSADPAAFAQLSGFFDIIVADVPCSGEGMFRKDGKAVADWSLQTVALCASRQRRIIADAWPALRRGGLLVYSTCTFEPDENDNNVRWVCDELGAAPVCQGDGTFSADGVICTDLGYLLVPGSVPGEGQWVGAAVKLGGDDSRQVKKAKTKDAAGSGPVNFAHTLFDKGGNLIAIPDAISAEISAISTLKPLMTGVLLGEMKGRTLVPSGDLAMCQQFDRDAFPLEEVDLGTALHFLHRDAIVLPGAPLGHVCLTYKGHPLGFVKNLGNRCNNLHPQNRRILKQIEI